MIHRNDSHVTTKARSADRFQGVTIDHSLIVLDLLNGEFYHLSGPDIGHHAAPLAPAILVDRLRQDIPTALDKPPLLRIRSSESPPRQTGTTVVPHLQLLSTWARDAYRHRSSLRGSILSDGLALRHWKARVNANLAIAVAWLLINHIRFSGTLRLMRFLGKHTSREATTNDCEMFRSSVGDVLMARMLPCNCLTESVAIMIYGATHRVRLDWCIGVKLAPFAAHAWVRPPNIACGGGDYHVLWSSEGRLPGVAVGSAT